MNKTHLQFGCGGEVEYMGPSSSGKFSVYKCKKCKKTLLEFRK